MLLGGVKRVFIGVVHLYAVQVYPARVSNKNSTFLQVTQNIVTKGQIFLIDMSLSQLPNLLALK